MDRRSTCVGAAPTLACFTCATRCSSEWQALTDAELAPVHQGKLTRDYRPGEAVFAEGEAVRGLFCVARGLLVLRRTVGGGHSVALRLVHAGQTAGGRDAIAGARHSTSAVALAASTVCRIPRDLIRTLLGRHAALGERMLRRLADDGDDAERALARLAGSTLRQRVIHLLLGLLPDYGRINGAGAGELRLPLSWRDVSALVWSRPESVSRAVHDLERRGLLHRRGAVLTLPDLSGLRAELP